MILKYILFTTLLATMISSSAVAGPGHPTGKLLGSFNMIGHPKNVDVLPNDNSNGRAIMVPLKNARGAQGPTVRYPGVERRKAAPAHSAFATHPLPPATRPLAILSWLARQLL